MALNPALTRGVPTLLLAALLAGCGDGERQARTGALEATLAEAQAEADSLRAGRTVLETRLAAARIAARTAVERLRRSEAERDAAERAVAAAEQALAAVDDLNARPADALAGIAGWQPLRTGIALHEGEVFFGNVGAPERLDFTLIGRAVNAASRVEALCKTLGREILITEPVAGRLVRPLDDLGRHPLRGLAKPISLFSPPASEKEV